MNTQQIVDYLNELCQLDKAAVHSVMRTDFIASMKFLDHPTCVASDHRGCDALCRLSALGVINGMLASLGEKKIGASFDDASGFVGFVAVDGV